MHDIAIIGGGIAGITAAKYAKRYGLSSVIVSPDIGGLLLEIMKIYNYPGKEDMTGPTFAQELREEIKDIEKIHSKVVNIEEGFKIHTEDGKNIKSKTIILATGTHKKGLNLNEEKYMGKGVSYCATCDAPLFTGKDVIIYGKDYAASHSALVLSTYAKNLKIINPNKELNVEKEVIKNLKKNGVEIVNDSKITNIEGNDFLEKVEVNNKHSLDTDGLFINIGSVPSVELLNSLNVKLSENGFIETDEKMRTSHKGVFAAGDVMNKNVRQLVTAASDGALAANSAHKYLNYLSRKN